VPTLQAPPVPNMRPCSRRSARTSRRVTLPVAALVLGLVAPALAFAHGALRRSTPASSARLTEAPRDLRLEFTEAPELAVATVELFGPDSGRVALAPLATAPGAPSTIVAAIRGLLVAGTYTVAWKIAGKDGHPVRGRFRFTIAAGAAGLGVAPISPAPDSIRRGEPGASVTPPGQLPPPAEHHDPANFPETGAFGAESPAYVAVRWLQFTALLLVLGAVAFRYAVLGFVVRKQTHDSPMLDDARDRAATIGLWAGVAMIVAAVLRLYAQSYAMHGASDVLNAGMITTMLGRTVWGWGWLLQLAGVVAALAGFAAARRGNRAGWALAAVGAAALAFSPALSGHAASVSRLTPLAVLADAAHVVGAGGWLGSLLFVVAAGIPAALRLPEGERGPAVAALVNAFSPTALVFAGLAAATGVFAAWLHLENVAALWQTSYGRTLLLKLAILSVVAGTGAYNWLRVKPALGNVEGARRIRRSASVELAVGVLVLIVTAVLVATPPAMEPGDAMAHSPAAAR
jgi:putative copper export protein/methionine-rich copper-binding protein CopC